MKGQPHASHQQPGPLFLMGGGEDGHHEARLLAEFLSLAGERDARLAVLAIGPGAGRTGLAQAHTLRRLGIQQVHLLPIPDRAMAVSRRTLRAVENATGVLLTGHEHASMTSLLGGTALDGLLHERRASGVPLAASDAGASLLGSLMIVGGSSRMNPRSDGVALYPGLEFLPGVVVDTRFSERCRHGRLLAAVAICPQDLGLGIDADTAALVTGEQLEVLGRGAITVYDAGSCTYSNVHEIQSGDSMALHDLRVHVLPAGHRFHLGLRAPMIEPSTVISRRMGGR